MNKAILFVVFAIFSTSAMAQSVLSSEEQQSKGWEWAITDSMKSATDYFVEPIEYLYHPSHPQYRFINDYRDGIGYNDANAYNNKGVLVRVGNIINIDDYDLNNLAEQILLEICKRDFLANKYNINSASKEDLLALKLIFGITNNLDADYKKCKKMVDDADAELMRAYAEKNYGRYRRAKDMAGNAALKMLKYELKKVNEVASGYIDRLKAEHRNDLSYLYKIERVDDKAFKFYFLNDKMECGCIAQIKWHNKAPYEATFDVKLLPCETIQIKTPEKEDVINATTDTTSYDNTVGWYESQSTSVSIIDGKIRRETIKIKRQAKFYGRHVMIPTPQLNGDINGVQGKVVVKVWVDRNGRVLKEECPAEGSTTIDEALIAATREAIHNARFSADENAPEEQVGTVAIIYEIEKSNY